jgi:hypothetical protein
MIHEISKCDGGGVCPEHVYARQRLPQLIVSIEESRKREFRDRR